MKKKFEIQDTLYEFPYHYLAHLDDGVPQIKRSLGWGIEYLTYMGYVIDLIHSLECTNILDVGCGDGYLLNNLKTPSDKLGVDLSEKAISFAKGFSKSAKFEVRDIFEMTRQFDVVSLIEVLEHIEDNFVEKFMTQVLRLVKPGGFFVISVPTTVIPVNKKHYRHYDEKLLSDQVEKVGNLILVSEKRVYALSIKLKIILRLFNNQVYSINSKRMLSALWKWHISNTYWSDTNAGQHIVRLYRKD